MNPQHDNWHEISREGGAVYYAHRLCGPDSRISVEPLPSGSHLIVLRGKHHLDRVLAEFIGDRAHEVVDEGDRFHIISPPAPRLAA